MERKHYIAKGQTSVSISVEVNGVYKRIEFDKGYRMGNYVKFASFATTDKDLQKALEAIKFPVIEFSYSEHIDDPVEVKEVAEEAKNEPTEEVKAQVFEDIKTIKEAIALLTAEPFNLKAVQCNSKSKLQKKMAELHVEFPNIAYDL